MSRDRIFAAAKAVLAQEGIPGLTIRKVARHAGLSPMAMYNHFADKDALVNALMEDGIGAWEEIVGAIRARDPIKWLERLIDAFLEFALTQPHRFDAAFFLPASEARKYPDDFASGRSRILTAMMRHIDRAKEEGRLGERPTLEVALALAALGQGFVSMHRARRFSDERKFMASYRVALHHCLDSFGPAGKGR
ncbi:MAG TPA: TetR/AcrR family transcriptional regulator [Steroidobacteraceae bacterium]|jgi:AcrR family transcriptional regulator